VAGAWQLAVNADLALPEVPGRRTPSVRFPNGYVGRVLAAAEHDDLVARRFMWVTGMLDSPPTRSGLGRRRGRSAVADAARVSSRRSATGCQARAS
jgi:hypothetical protein